MLHCLSANAINSSANVTRHRTTVSPEVRCQSSRVVPILRSKISTDFLIIPERRKADFLGTSNTYSRTCLDPLDECAVPRPRCHSSFLPSTSPPSPLSKVKRKVGHSHSHARHLDSKTLQTCDKVFSNRIDKQLRMLDRHNLLLESDIYQKELMNDKIAGITQPNVDEECFSSDEEYSSDVPYDRDEVDVEALYLQEQKKKRQADIGYDSTSLSTEASLRIGTLANMSPFTSPEDGAVLGFARFPSVDSEPWGGCDSSKPYISSEDKILPLDEFMEHSLSDDVDQIICEEQPIPVSSREALDFSLIFSNRRIKNKANSDSDRMGRQPLSVPMSSSPSPAAVYTEQVTIDENISINSIKRLGMRMQGEFNDGFLHHETSNLPRKSNKYQADVFQRGDEKENTGAKLVTGDGIGVDLESSQKGVLTRRQAAALRTKTQPAASFEKDWGGACIDHTTLYPGEAERPTSTSGMQNTSIAGSEEKYLGWLRFVKKERLPCIASAFREWKEIQMSLQCLKLSMSHSSGSQSLSNPILADARKNLQRALPSVSIEMEVEELVKQMQDCWNTMIQSPSSADEVSPEPRLVESRKTRARVKQEAQQRKRAKREPRAKATPSQSTSFSTTQRKRDLDADEVIEVEDSVSPEALPRSSKRRTPNSPLSPFVSLGDVTPPRKKQRLSASEKMKDGDKSSDGTQLEDFPLSSVGRTRAASHRLTRERSPVQRPPSPIVAPSIDDTRPAPSKGVDIDEATDVEGPLMEDDLSDENRQKATVPQNPSSPEKGVPNEGYPKPAFDGVFCHYHGDVPAADKSISKRPFHYTCSLCEKVASRIRMYCQKKGWRLDSMERSKEQSWNVKCHCFHNHLITGEFDWLRTQSRCPVCMDESRNAAEKVRNHDWRKEEWAQEHQRKLFASAREKLKHSAGTKSCPLWTASRFDCGPPSQAFTDADVNGQATIESLLKCSGEKNPWVVLCIGAKKSNISYEAAKARYKKWVKRVHPDKNSHPSAKEAFHILDSAWKRIESSH